MTGKVPLDGPTLRRIIDVVPHPIVVTDLTGTIQLWNAVSEERFGWTEAEVLGTSAPTAMRDLRFAQAWLARELAG